MLLSVDDDDYAMVGPVKWDRSRWDLDRLTAVYIGSQARLATFIATLTLGASYSGDSNMKMMDWDNDDDPVKPKVAVRYQGRKGGTLPPDRNGAGFTIQQAQFTSFFYSDTDGMRITLTYIAPTSTKVKWGTSAVDIASIGAVTPADCEGVWWTAEAHGSWVGSIPASIGDAISWFVQEEAILGDSEEVIPSAYFRGTQTKQNLLFSSEF